MVPILAAVLVFVVTAVAAALAILLPAGGRGLEPWIALVALASGLATGVAAFFQTRAMPANRVGAGRISAWGWLMFAAFALFALRSYCWLAYEEGDTLAIGSSYNLGDVSMHLQFARYFADGARWWPDHPEAADWPLRYYPGVDLFQSLWLTLGAPDLEMLVWVGLIGSAVTLLALYRWGGTFTVAAFLFNGGLAGFQVFRQLHFADYQSTLAWKNVATTMFVTQRPWLVALPVGLLLLAHWREKFFAAPPPAALAGRSAPPGAGVAGDADEPASWARRGLIPFWIELLLYALLPAFHFFAFAFLSMLLGWWFLAYFLRPVMRRHLSWLVAASVLPATGLVMLITARFRASQSALWLEPGWMQHETPFLTFWLNNFGLFALLAPVIWFWSAGEVARAVSARRQAPPLAAHPEARRPALLPLPEAEVAAAFVLPAGVIFLVCCFVMFAPWDWDNTKLILWCYLAMLPTLWRRFVRPLAAPLRWPLCALLFFSGAVSLTGGLGHKNLNYRLIDRAELDDVRVLVRDLPVEARFACAPEYNHPLVYCGRKLAEGYDGHLRSDGIDYAALGAQLDEIMNGGPDWHEIAVALGVRYIFWGPREDRRYPRSLQPWAKDREPVATDNSGAIYDLQSAPHS